MGVETRSSATSKEDEILRALSVLSSRLDNIQGSIDGHGEAIEKLQTKHSMAERLISKINEDIMDTNVPEACGVDYNQIKRNGLLGENAPRRSETVEAKAERRRKQAFGAKIFTVYVVCFCVLMAMSFFDLLPVFDWERREKEYFFSTFDTLGGTMHFPFLMSFIYLITIFGIKRVLKDSKPFDLRTPLALWSLAIGLFSIFGSLRTVPTIVKMLRDNGFNYVACGDTRKDWVYNEPAGIWTWFFILSKVPELIDTLFIVLRKRPLITLHWYHHITVLCFCWHSWATCCVNGIFFSSMNLTVHAMMYIFYSLAALGYRPTAYAQYITVIQILQMMVGTFITFYVNFHMWFIHPVTKFEFWSLRWNIDSRQDIDTTPQCKVNQTNALAGLIMYSSYLYLFCVFFYYAYINPKPKGSSKKKKN